MIEREDIEEEWLEGDSPEELDEEYARRINSEILHIQGERYMGEDGEDLTDDEECEGDEDEGDEDEGEDEGEDEPTPEPTSPSLLWLLFSGSILVRRGLAKYYGQMVAIALLFLVSIVVMFWSLHLDMRHSTLEREVQLLRERSVRLQEVRFSRTSHSAIVEELERRGIKLEDPTTPAIVIRK